MACPVLSVWVLFGCLFVCFVVVCLLFVCCLCVCCLFCCCLFVCLLLLFLYFFCMLCVFCVFVCCCFCLVFVGFFAYRRSLATNRKHSKLCLRLQVNINQLFDIQWPIINQSKCSRVVSTYWIHEVLHLKKSIQSYISFLIFSVLVVVVVVVVVVV